MLPIPGEPSSGVSFARASEAQFISERSEETNLFIGVKRKPLQNEGQGP